MWSSRLTVTPRCQQTWRAVLFLDVGALTLLGDMTLRPHISRPSSDEANNLKECLKNHISNHEYIYSLQHFMPLNPACNWGARYFKLDAAFWSSSIQRFFSKVVPADTVIEMPPPKITKALCSEFSVNRERIGTCPRTLKVCRNCGLLA